MDEPVRGESVSEEGGGVSTKRKESSGSLWHRSHLHSLAGSRWTDDRIDGQTECVGGVGGGGTDTCRHCCTAACCNRKDGDARR